ncbi:MAG: nucleotidyltransferase domain-containing protein [Deltaproteobacteria bacterium]|nr:nucleotidyltransferase domain-containing protein [Deltaproteobacteria bacterium]
MSYKFSLDESRALRELKDSLKEFLGDRIRLVLYGSRARGDYVNESDIDIAVIVRNLNRELKNQILDKIADVELKYLTPLSTLVLSEDDFTSLKNRERRIAMDIEKEGIPL